MRRDGGEATILLSMIGAGTTAAGAGAIAAASRLDTTESVVAILGGIVAIALSLGAAAGAVYRAINRRTAAKVAEAESRHAQADAMRELTSKVDEAVKVAYGAQSMMRGHLEDHGILPGR